jgi:predicted phosphoribosyltransferase
MYFKDRNEAAHRLARRLSKHKSPQTIVLAIPRGGVPIGCVIADTLQAPIDLLMAKKIGYPGNPEYAIGAICENEIIVEEKTGIRPEYILQQQDKIKTELKARYRILTGRDRPFTLTQKKVILTDDGIATGRTLLAAVRAVRKQQPASLIVAVPVCSLEAKDKLLPEVDDLISCYYPDPFIGVGRFYEQFSQVSDEEVSTMLQAANTSLKPVSPL